MPALVARLSDAGNAEPAHDLWMRLLRRWARENPRAAAAWADTLPTGSELRRDAGRLVAISRAAGDLRAARQWASQDPKAALEWAHTQDAEAQPALLADIAATWADTDPAAAAALAITIPAGKSQSDAIVAVRSDGFNRMPARHWIG
jgi:hypothetical protein